MAAQPFSPLSLQPTTPSTPLNPTLPWLPTPELLSQHPTLRHFKFCKSMTHLHQIHGQTITAGIFADNFVASRLLSFSALSPDGSLPYARRLFSHIRRPDAFTANTLIRGYSISPDPIDALLFYIDFSESSLFTILPDEHTFALLLRACSEIPSLSLGEMVHSQAVKFGWASRVSVQNFLVHMYAACSEIGAARSVFQGIKVYNEASQNMMLLGYLKCRLFDDARQMFDDMPERDTMSWSVMINGFVRDSRFKEGLEMFQKMLMEKVEPNESILVNVLSSCAHIWALEQGEWVEKYARKKAFKLTVKLGTALVDMYSKCGCVDKALRIFDELEDKNVMTWSAMIAGLAINGHGKDALSLFSQMEMQGLQPNEITFIGVLNACSHCGLVEDGFNYFTSMTRVYGIKPNVHHYCCLVDLYGRSGLLSQAEEVIKNMPANPNGAVLRALLNSCQIHGNSLAGECLGKQLIELEPTHSGHYLLLSNLYAANGRWEDVAELRRIMRERGTTKTPGCSFIELNGTVHEFGAVDDLHLQSEEILRC